MKTNRTTQYSALDRYMQDLETCPPLDAAEERRLTTRIRRLHERLARILDGLPELHRPRVLGGTPVRREAPFTRLDAIVARLAREAEEHGDAGLEVKARRARAVLRLLASARATLIARNLRLVYHLARRFAGHGTLLSDIVQVGNLALLEAADRFDPHRGVRFSTYAGMCIIGVINREMPTLTQDVHVPAYQWQLRGRLLQSRRSLVQDLGRDPTLAEMAAHARLPENKAKEIIESKPTIIDLDAPVPDSKNRTLADTLAADDATAVQDRLILRDFLDQMQHTLATLEPRMRAVVRLRYGLGGVEPRTLTETGAVMNLSRERIRQIEEEALKLLRARMRRPRAAVAAARPAPEVTRAWAMRQPA